MCGHVGFITHSSSGFIYKETQTVKQMLFVDTLRGEDATGVCIVNKEQGAIVYKEGTEASNFLLDKNVISAFGKALSEGVAILGHNRKATVGGHKDTNAHPFTYDDRYVFFHNGTLLNHKTFGDEEVDSESLGKHLVATEGDPEKVAEVINKAFGAWCCIWYDSVKHCIYFLRNKERPLYFLHTKDGGIIYSSEPWIAAGCGARNGIQFEKTEMCEEDVLYTLDLTKPKLEFIKDSIPKKVFVTSPPGSQKTIIGGTKTKHISRKLGDCFIRDLKKMNWVTFRVTDVVCATPGNEPASNECGDWIVFGVRDDMKGVEFRGIIENLFPYEANNLEGKDVGGMLEDAQYGSGVVEAWFHEVYEHKGASCH